MNPQPGMPSLNKLAPALRLLLSGADRSVAWRLAAGTLLAVVGGALAGATPLALKEMVDAAASFRTTPDAAASMALFGAAYLICLGAGRLLSELRPILTSAAEQRLFAWLRCRYFEHLLGLPLAFHLGRRTGAVVHNLQQAISGYQVISYHVVNSFVPVLVEAATVAIVLLTLGQPALTLTFAATAAAYFGVMWHRTAGLSRAAQKVADTGMDVQALLTDGLMNYEPIKCFGAERTVLAGFEQTVNQLEDRWAQLQKQRLWLGVAVSAIFCISLTASLLIAAMAVADGTLTVGGFVLANLYTMQVIRPLEMVCTAVRETYQGLAFVRPLMDIFAMPTERSLLSILEHPQRSDPGPGGQDPAPAQSQHVSFEDIHLTFDAGRPVLAGFSLNVPAGSSVAIVGPSGGGKSTLVRLLLRLVEPQQGIVRLSGIDVATIPAAELRSRIAIVPQDVMLLNATVAVNIGIGKDGATPAEIERAACIAGLHDFITTLPFGYDTAIGERGLKLSGGERQRIAIARAVLRDPDIYVFDEATSMLDAGSEASILQSLRKISMGRTTLTIAHRLSSIQNADLIAVLLGGRIVEQGDHEALLALGGAYAQLWRSQMAGA
ncbi:ABC transporter ATP-binding protein [Roseateles sp.]|uniref:ABC transporter ATP-binding protein n=1 Tax=Roseateles sp. TaxID=1971397 RepID=UPI0032672DCF